MIPLRDHYRTSMFTAVNGILILINIAVFIYMYSLSLTGINNFIQNYAMIPANLTLSSLVTSQFLHGGILHLLSNILFLHIFGDNLEDRMGHLPYLIFYLTCGVIAALTQYLFIPNSTIPMLGASGAIAGAMGGYLIAFPHSKVDVLIPIFILFPIITIPAFAMLIYWIGTQILLGSAVSGLDAGGIAYSAHIGGFVAGAILVNIFPKRTSTPKL